MSYVNALFHIVICTYQRKPTIPAEFEEDVYRFIWEHNIALTGSHPLTKIVLKISFFS